MPRVSYANVDSAAAGPAAKTIAATRANGKLLNVDKTLLHNPELALGWRAFFGAVRTKCSLPDLTREIASLRVAVLNRAEYEFSQHAPIALKLGMSQAQLDSLRMDSPSGFSEADALAIRLCDAMTRDIQVPDSLMSELKKVFDDRRLVELTVTIAAYNCVSRVLEALKVENE